MKVAAAEFKQEEKKNSSILGKFTGKCCDSNVFNNNDMHLSRELFETLMNSDEYKRAMEYRHYTGFLGHPENPDCQDDQNACIVMTDMRLLDNGEIEGDFDLIDTPVGRIVKAFTDAGVKYGLSIRGLGDVDGNGEVDPEGFVFRGFDLVRFPAYDDCIPEFKAIAASTDAKKKAAAQKVYASINANLKAITSAESLLLIQDQFEDNSNEYKMIQDRIDELTIPEAANLENYQESECLEDNCCEDVSQQRLDAVMQLYLDASNKVRELESALAECQLENQTITVECNSAKSKYSHMKRIVAGQLETARNVCDDASRTANNNNRKIARITASLDSTKKQLKETKAKLAEKESSYEKVVTANTNLRIRLDDMIAENHSNKEAIEAANHMNLKYKQKVEAKSDVISQKDSTIEDIKQQLHETVVANKKLESKASNLDEANGHLLARVEAAENMVLQYQQAYANIYANALGVYLKDLPVTASTSVDELKRMISAGTNTAGIPAAPTMYAEDDEVIAEDMYDEDGNIIGTYGANLSTM